jgi:predicted nucleotidyltransferase
MAQVNARVLRAARKFVRDVSRTGVRLHGAYLYGSYATGRAHRHSDIDIALISPDFTGWIDDLPKISDAMNKMDPRIEAVRFRPESFVDENPLAWEVKTKGISLLEPRRPRKRRAKSMPSLRVSTRHSSRAK